ncbi:hypothetical protein MNBD_GAMMA16-939 [hydrothermal vent metagenome]|uniref:Outer membrane protein assembly factor BamE domain-containing protein n=1 Tax=hydrothermal vent metagenome TaxID=652676 RepID=A0A3B0Z434_9ZZZZ
MRNQLITSTIIASLFALGCSVHRIDIQQGTVFDAEHVTQLKLGITREEVQKILGTPPIADPFHKNRWDYIYTMSQPNKTPEEKQITVFFEKERLIRVLTSIAPAIDATDATNAP